MKKFKKILIANRGEIAVRIIKTCQKLNISTGIVYAENDKNSLAVRSANESFNLSGKSLQDTYLNIDQIVRLAKKHRFDAIHPGYGFLSENAKFSKACENASIDFIGPIPDVIKLMGDKVKSKKLAEDAGVPILQPILGDIETLKKNSDKLKYPVLIKAVSGGGGKGMRIVRNKENLSDALVSTSREAKNYFKDEKIFIEKYIEEPRHIEIQVLADHHGNSVVLFERECSLQRRHQKVIEEAPSPSFNSTKRRELMEHAIQIVKSSGYTNAGTIEFMADEKLNFYFLEMNTRIQVEHPTTEMITGIDLVEEQIRIAEGHRLSFQQSDLKINGHAIEARIYAEDPENNFFPSPGLIHFYEEPKNEQMRIDSSTEGPTIITDDFDPMIAKIISWGKDRKESIEILSKGLNNYFIHGVKTNISYLDQLLNLPEFKKNQLSTHLIEQKSIQLIEETAQRKSRILPALLIAFSYIFDQYQIEKKNIWEEIGPWKIYPKYNFIIDRKEIECFVETMSDNQVSIKSGKKAFLFQIMKAEGNQIVIDNNGNSFTAIISRNSKNQNFITIDGLTFVIDKTSNLLTQKIEKTKTSNRQHNGQILSPMPGKIIEIPVKKGQKVKKGEKLMVLEAMKMENLVTAPDHGTIEQILVKLNDRVEAGINLIQINLNETSSIKKPKNE